MTVTYTLNEGGDAIIRTDGVNYTYIPIPPSGIAGEQYLTWLSEGNTPNPYDAPPPPKPLTAAEKLEAAGLTVDELKELLGL